MPGPQIEPGRIEQGIYTWSTLDVEGKKGQWFGALSPGLNECLAWLRSLSFGSFQPLDNSLEGSYGDAYRGWEKQITVGALPVGDFSFVYRLIPKAGEDNTRRSRFVAHVLVGRREELGLFSIAEDDPHWLEAEDCRLDDLPHLPQLDLATLKPFRPPESREAVEKTARDLLVSWKTSADGLTCNVPTKVNPGQVTAALLTVVPTPLWNNIELDWRIGDQGPIAYMRIRNDAPAHPLNGSAEIEGLSDGSLHESADRHWESRMAQRQTWATFVASFAFPEPAAPPLPKDGEGKTPPARREKSASEAQPAPNIGSPREEILARIGSDLGNPDWRHGDGLNEEQALRALRTIEKHQSPTGGWLATLLPADLQSLFAPMESNTAIGKAKRIFKAEKVPLGTLVGIWWETGLAVVGAGLLDHDPRALQRYDSWALPTRLDETQLKHLVAYAGSIADGYPKIATLLRGGFLSTGEGREAFAKAAVDAEVHPRRLFEDILPHADLELAELLEIIRENLALFSQWLNMPEEYENALREGLRPGFWHRLKDHF